MAVLKINRAARKGPQPKLLKFLKRYYSLVLDKEPKLSEAIKALEEAKKPDPKQQGPLKTKVGQALKSLPSKVIKGSQFKSNTSKKKKVSSKRSKNKGKTKSKSESKLKKSSKANNRSKIKFKTKPKPKRKTQSNRNIRSKRASKSN